MSDEKIKGYNRDYVVLDTRPANESQIGGIHYKRHAIQPWDYIAANELDYFQGNIVKYVTRHKYKDGIEDLKKAMHYLQKLIELEKERLENKPQSQNP